MEELVAKGEAFLRKLNYCYPAREEGVEWGRKDGSVRKEGECLVQRAQI